jgi:hypothetical protein
VGASLSLQQLNVLCSAPFGRSNEFAYAELKSNVAASLASTVTNVHAAMTIVLRVIKNRDMSTHTLFSMMDSSKKVLLPQLPPQAPASRCLISGAHQPQRVHRRPHQVQHQAASG